MTKTRELQLAARKAEDSYIALGRTIVTAYGEFCPVFGGLESFALSVRINRIEPWSTTKRARRDGIVVARNRRVVMGKRLSRSYLP